MLKAKEYYKILHFLKVETADRFYPVEDYFYELDDEGNEHKIIYEGDSFLFETNRESFVGMDYVEVLLEATESYNTSDLKLNLSEYTQGYDPLVVLSSETNFDLIPNTPKKVVFPMDKSQTMSDVSRNLTNIKSIELITPNNSDFKIYDICFRNDNATYNLEQLDSFYEDGKYYVLSRLHMDTIPVELADHVFTATAGYGWMSTWEYDSRIMNDEQKDALSYGKWLFAQVDKAIDLYKKAHGIADDEELFVKDDIATSRYLHW